MTGWRPKPRAGVDLRSLPLSPLQGYLLSRLDGTSDVNALAQVTGQPADQVTSMLAELVTLGAVEANPEPAAAPVVEPEPLIEATVAEAEEDDDDDGEPAEEPPANDGTHQKLFESAMHSKPLEERVTTARFAIDPVLSALCYDPQPQVILALLDNPHFGLAHARLVARHHRNGVGLEALASKAVFANDANVRRVLVRNPQLPGSLFRRLWQGRRLHEHYLLVISRDLPEATKRIAREQLRARFASGPSEERVQLIVKTEGRCLTHLLGVAFDSKTTALLCGRTYGSTLFVQNLARFSASPPALIAHLLKQEVVRRSPQLKLLLERHPNAPRER